MISIKKKGIYVIAHNHGHYLTCYREDIGLWNECLSSEAIEDVYKLIVPLFETFYDHCFGIGHYIKK
jgi:hypothetical protein